MSTDQFKRGLTKADRALYKECMEGMKRNYPFVWAFVSSFPSNCFGTRRFGKARVCHLYLLLSRYGCMGPETKPRDFGRSADVFWDLADIAASLGGDRYYAMTTLLLYYRYLSLRRCIAASFGEGLHSPVHMFYGCYSTDPFQMHMKYHYVSRDRLFFLRHGRQQNRTHFLVLDYRNEVLRDLLIESVMRWPEAWRHRRPSRLDLLKDAESWFEGTTDGVRSYRDFNATMLDTGKRHILAAYEGEWRTLAMRFLFLFFSELVLAHPDHDFFAGSYVYCSELVVDKRIPIYLADGYVVAVSGQRDVFHQGRGALFVVRDADLYGASYRKTEIRRYDLTKITNPVYWDAIANFILHNGRSDIQYAKRFLIWLDERKRAVSEDSCHIYKEDMDAYRVEIARRMTNGGSRNVNISTIRKVIKWLCSKGFITVDKDALSHFGYFFTNSEPNSNPLTKETVALLRQRLHEMGQTEPRYLLSEILFDIMLITDPRCGSLATLAVDDITWHDDGSCGVRILQKNSGKEKTSFILAPQAADRLRQAVEMTAPLRERYCKFALSGNVFIYKLNNQSLPVSCMTVARFNLDLKAAGADVCGKITSGRIRDTMYTLLDLYLIGEDIPDYKRPALTHHANRRSINAYSIFTINDILERSPEVTVGRILTF